MSVTGTFVLLLVILGLIVVAIVAWIVVGLVRAGKGLPGPPWPSSPLQFRTEAIVEIRSGVLAAFDIPNEVARYPIPDFEPGLYRVPIDAVMEAPDNASQDQLIGVDLATIFLVDAENADQLREINERLRDETGSLFGVVDRYDQVVEEVGVRFDYLMGAADAGIAFVGDGTYMLDVSRIERIGGAAENEPETDATGLSGSEGP